MDNTRAQTSASSSIDEEEEDAPSFYTFQQHWWCDILVEKEQQEKTTGARVMYSSLALGIYNGKTGRWEFGSSQQEQCPTGLCQREQLGRQTVYIPCASCEKELTWWERWLKTMFWIMAGKFRKAQENEDFESFSVTISTQDMSPDPVSSSQRQEQSKKKKSNRKHAQKTLDRTYAAQRIAFDASYFTSSPRKSRGIHSSRSDTHLVLTHEEAVREGALQVDMEGILIRDWSSVRGYWRRKRKGGTDTRYVAAKEKRGQLISLATWKARQRAREYHSIQRILASTFSFAHEPIQKGLELG